jgi:hypothetical protein
MTKPSFLHSQTLISCFTLLLASSCRSGDNPAVRPEPAASASVALVSETAPSTSSASAIVPSIEPTVVASSEPFPEASASAAVVNGPPKAPPLIPKPRVRPLGANEVVAVLIRSKPKGGSKPEESTQFIRADGKITSQKGAHLFINGKLHRYHRRENTSHNPPCFGEKENIFPKRIWRNAEFVPTKDGKSIEIIPAYKPNPKNDEIIHTETDHELVAALPGFVFIKSSETDYGCGAHPLYGSGFVLFAVTANGSFEKVESSEYLEGTDAWLEHAQAKFNAQVDPAESPDSLDGPVNSPDNVKVAMVYPMITAKGAVWGALFTAPATWAGSFGGWAGYTRAVPMPINKAPTRFRDAMVTPEPVNEYVSKHEKDEDILGFTVGEGE